MRPLSARFVARAMAPAPTLLFSLALGCSLDGDDRNVLERSSTMTADPTSLMMDVHEIATVMLTGELRSDPAHEIHIQDVPEGLQLVQIQPGRVEVSSIVDFHEEGDKDFTVSVGVECTEPTTGTLVLSITNPDEARLDVKPDHPDYAAFIEQTTVSIDVECGPPAISTSSGTSPATISTSSATNDTMGTTGDSESDTESESETEDDSDATTGSGRSDATLVCRNLQGVDLTVVTFDGPDAGSEAVAVGGFVAQMATREGSSEVVAGWFSETDVSGFARWDSPLDLLDAPAQVVPNEAASGYAVSCSTSAGAVFGGFGVDAVFCDWDEGECTSLGLPQALLSCECVGDACVGDLSSTAGVVRSDDGGRSFSAPAGTMAPSGIFGDGQGHMMFYDGGTLTIEVSDDAGQTFSTATLPAGAEAARPFFMAPGVAFLADSFNNVAARSIDNLESWQTYTPPDGTLRPIARAADGRLLTTIDGVMHVSTDDIGDDWEARPDIEVPQPFQCVAVPSR